MKAVPLVLLWLLLVCVVAWVASPCFTRIMDVLR
jgi:hypothetical protein